MSKENSFVFINNADERILKAVSYLKKKKFIIISATIAGIAFGIFYSSVKKPLYTANLSFSIEGDNDMSGSSLLSIASQFGFNLGGGLSGVFAGDNVMELFKSRRIVEQTLLQPYAGSKTSLADKYLDILGWRSSLGLKQNFFPLNSANDYSREQDSLMGAMHEFIVKAVLAIDKPDKNMNIYNISFKSTDETFTKEFTEDIADEVKEFYTETKTKRAKETVDLLQRKADSLRRAYDYALYGRAQLSDANLNPAFQVPQVNEQKKQTDVTVLGTAYGELLKNLEVAKFTLLKSTPLLQIIDVPHYPLKKKTYPYWLYIPLGLIGFACVAVFFLISFKIIAEIFSRYWKV